MSVVVTEKRYVLKLFLGLGYFYLLWSDVFWTGYTRTNYDPVLFLSSYLRTHHKYTCQQKFHSCYYCHGDPVVLISCWRFKSKWKKEAQQQSLDGHWRYLEAADDLFLSGPTRDGRKWNCILDKLVMPVYAMNRHLLITEQILYLSLSTSCHPRPAFPWHLTFY